MRVLPERPSGFSLRDFGDRERSTSSGATAIRIDVSFRPAWSLCVTHAPREGPRPLTTRKRKPARSARTRIASIHKRKRPSGTP
jgi:hypothetical protein